MRVVIIVLAAISFVVISAKPEGYFRQNYQFKKSSATYKNNELQTKDDDEGFYTKQGDLEGKSTPQVDQGNEHREFVNPSVDGFGHTITKYNDRDLTSEAESAFSRHGIAGTGSSMYSGHTAGYGTAGTSYGSSDSFGSAGSGYGAGTTGHTAGYGTTGTGYGSADSLGTGTAGYRTGSGYSSRKGYSSNSGFSSGSSYGSTAGTHDTSTMDQNSNRQTYSYGRAYEGSSQTGRSSYTPNYGMASNLAVVTQNVQQDLSKQVQDALTTLRQNTYSARRIESEDIRQLENELRSNLTAHLQEALNRQYGTQEKRGSYSYTVSSGGRYSPRANYDNQELIDLKSQVEQELLKQLREGVRYTESSYQYDISTSHSSNYGTGTVHRDSAEVEDLNRHRPSYSDVLQQKTHTPERITEPNTRSYQTYNTQSRYPTSSSQYRPVYTTSTPLERVVVQPTLSVSVVAQNVQNDLSKKVIESIRNYEDLYSSPSYHLTNSRPDYQTKLNDFKYELKNNITRQLYDELEKTYGRQYQRGGYWFTEGSTNIANYKQEDLDILKKQMEDNLIKYLETSFRDQEDRYITSQSHSSSSSSSSTYQTGRKYNQYSPSYTKSLTSEGVNTGYVYNPKPSYIPSSQISTGQNSYGSTYNTENSQVELQQIKSEIERDLARQMQVAIHEQQPISTTYTNQAAIQDLTEEMKRNLTAKLQETLQKRYGQQGMRNGYSYTVSASGVYNPKANYNSQDMQRMMQQMQDDLVRQLNEQMNRRETHSSTSSQYASGYQPSQSAYGAGYGGATKGRSYAKSSSYSYSASHGTTGDECVSCMQSDQSHNTRSKRSYTPYNRHYTRYEDIDLGNHMMFANSHRNPTHDYFGVGQEEEDFGQHMEQFQSGNYMMTGKLVGYPQSASHHQFELGQEEEDFGQQMEEFANVQSHSHHNHFGVGQRQEEQIQAFQPNHPMRGNLNVVSHHANHADSDVGQEVEEFGQQIEEFEPQMSGNLFTKPPLAYHQNSDVGQEVEDFGQKIEMTGNLHKQTSHGFHEDSEVGQEEEVFVQHVLDTEPYNQITQNLHKQSEVGQEEEDFGQQMVDIQPHQLTQGFHQGSERVQIGAQFHPNHQITGNLHKQVSHNQDFQVGQIEEDFGQQQEDFGQQQEDFGQQMEDFHGGHQMSENLHKQASHGTQSDVGQEEEDLGQQMEHVGQQLESSEQHNMYHVGQVEDGFGKLEFGNQKFSVADQKQESKFVAGGHYNRISRYSTTQRPTSTVNVLDEIEFQKQLEEYEREMANRKRISQGAANIEQEDLGQQVEDLGQQMEDLGQQMEDLDTLDINQRPQNIEKFEIEQKQEGFGKLETGGVTKPQSLRGDQTEKFLEDTEVTSKKPHSPSFYSQNTIQETKPATEVPFKPFKPQYTHNVPSYYSQNSIQPPKQTTEAPFKPFKPQYTHNIPSYYSQNTIQAPKQTTEVAFKPQWDSIGQEPEDEFNEQQQVEEDNFQSHHYNMQSQYVNKPQVTNTFVGQDIEDLNQQQIEEEVFPKYTLSSQNSNIAPAAIGRTIPDSYSFSHSGYNYGTAKHIEGNVEQVEDMKPIETHTAKVTIHEEQTTTPKPGFWGKVGGSITNTYKAAKEKAHGFVERLG